MADRLAAGLGALPGVRLVQPVEANELFVAMPESLIAGLRARGLRVPSLARPARRGPGRWCAWSRASPRVPEEVDALVAAATRLAAQGFG